MKKTMATFIEHFIIFRRVALLGLVLAGGLSTALGFNWLGARQAAAAATIETGPLTQFAADAYPASLVYGPEGAFWFTLGGENAIGRYEPAAGFTSTFPLTTSQARLSDLAIASRYDLWLTENAADQIGHFDLRTRIFQHYKLDDASYPAQITLGQDGTLWFTEFEGNQIGQITAEGAVHSFPLPESGSLPLGIVTAPDGNLWFTEWGGYRIGRLTPEGELTEFDLSPSSFRPASITNGPDGALWFTFELGQSIGRIDPISETLQIFSLPTTLSSSLLDIRTGPEGWLWFLGIASVGRFQAGAGGPTQLEETPITPIFEGEGRSQIVAGPAAEMVFITGNSSTVFTATVPGALGWRDLQVFINDLPPALLAGGSFTVTAEIQNWSNNFVNEVQAVLPLDEEIQFQRLLAPAGEVNCSIHGQTATCPLGSMLPNSTLPLTVTLEAGRMNSYPTTRRFDIQITAGEPDHQPANNRTYRDLVVTSFLEYANDFELGSDSHWSPTHTHQTASGLAYLGPFAAESVNFTWKNLPPHDRIYACFDWYILGEWDGSATVEPQAVSPMSNFIGPDIWSYYVNQDRMLVSSFSNREGFEQSFPADYSLNNFPARHKAFALGDFDDQPGTTDSRYRQCQTVQHAAENLNLTYLSQNINERMDEKWALDNVYIKVFYWAAFDHIFMPLISTGGP